MIEFFTIHNNLLQFVIYFVSYLSEKKGKTNLQEILSEIENDY
jgi:hypothetical protein